MNAIYSIILVDLLTWLILGYFFVINTVYLVLLVVSFFSTRKLNKSRDAYEITGLFDSDLYKSVSVLLPVYNEEENIRSTVYSLIQLDFNDFEIIVINDGSTDNTFEILQKEFELFPSERFIPEIVPHKPLKGVYKSNLFPNLIVLDKENGKKADALNAGVNASRKDVICNVDSDSWLEPDILKKMLRAFVEDETSIAVGGIVRIANGSVFERGRLKQILSPNSFLGKIQVVEYLRSFLFGRIGWSSVDGLIIISGAFAVFDRTALIETGGYNRESIGEDIEIVVNMHQHFIEKGKPYSMCYLPEPVCWTKVPESWDQLAAQRNRWHRGLADTLFKHKKMIGNPNYGWLGMFSLPFHLFFELLGPILELASYLLFFTLMITGLLNAEFAILFILFAVLYGLILSVGSILLDELTYKPHTRLRDVFSITIHAVFENFGFRQLHFWWRLRGLFDYLRRNKEWNIKDPNPTLTNALHWGWFAAFNLFFLSLLYYGMSA